ncbi:MULTISPECIES: hypothetical protein [Ligilactobacillus]|nr:hypothetical protein [Ligilactobacillus murinus]
MDYIDLRIGEDPVLELVYIEYKYRINPRTHEWLLGDISITHMDSEERYELMKFHGKIEQTHTLKRDKDGNLDRSGDGYVYFNDIEELVFDKATESDKKCMRERIKEEMMICDSPVTGWWMQYIT